MFHIYLGRVATVTFLGSLVAPVILMILIIEGQLTFVQSLMVGIFTSSLLFLSSRSLFIIWDLILWPGRNIAKITVGSSFLNALLFTSLHLMAGVIISG